MQEMKFLIYNNVKAKKMCFFKVNLSIPVDEGNDDVLDIDMLMELSTGTQERVQGLKVELIWENLFKTKCLVF